MGFDSWYSLGSYKAEIILLNNANSYGLDLVTWRTFQKSLPSLASQMTTQDNLTSNRKGIFMTMSDPQWWAKSVIPSYAISKADTKDLAMISKDLDSAATRILSFAINAGGQTKESALDHVRLASQFFRSGWAYLQPKTLLNAYESEIIGTAAEVQSKLNQT